MYLKYKGAATMDLNALMSTLLSEESIKGLGAKAEYRFNKHLGAWLKGGNLLNMDIRQSPMYSPLGPSVLAGITLSL